MSHEHHHPTKIVIETDNWPCLDVENIFIRHHSPNDLVALNLRLQVAAEFKDLENLLSPILRFSKSIHDTMISERLQEADFSRTWRITIEKI